jgi:hypothetical protein
VGTVPGSGHRFVVDGVQPESKYRYQIDGMLNGDRFEWRDDHRETDRAPLFAARLVGVYNVRMLRTSVYGVNGIPEKSTQGWRFLPPAIEGVRRRVAGTSTGTGWPSRWLAPVLSTAARTPSMATSSAVALRVRPPIRVTLHVTGARTIRDTWRVSAFEGTVTTYALHSSGVDRRGSRSRSRGPRFR